MKRFYDILGQQIRCSSGYWKCIGSTKCIPVQKICDSKNDCGDSSDEGSLCCAYF